MRNGSARIAFQLVAGVTNAGCEQIVVISVNIIAINKADTVPEWQLGELRVDFSPAGSEPLSYPVNREVL